MADIPRQDRSRNQATRSPFTNRSNGREPLPYKLKNSTRVRAASSQHENGLRETPVTSYSYYNYTDRDIVITTRDGTSVVVPPVGNYAADEIIVCVTHRMPRESMERAVDILRQRGGNDRETYYWVRAYEAALYNTTLKMLTASVEYVVMYTDIMDAGGRCYMPDVDLLVEWMADHGATHPFDKMKRDEAMITSVAPDLGEGTFVFMIKAVDNAPHCQRATRYINIGGDIYTIPIERDSNYPTGVHLVCRSPIIDGESQTTILTQSLTYEEADEKWSLCRTIEDAVTGGPIESMAKVIIERETTVRKVEEARLRTEQLDADAEIQRLRNEGAYAKAKQDKEAADRRNYVEWAKAGVSILGAAITVYGILSKLTGK